MPNSFANTASAYGNRLLDSLGVTARCDTARDAEHPALRYAQSGLLALTGRADAQPSICPVPLASCADGVLAALAALAGPSALDVIDGAGLLGERAALMGVARNGVIAAGGSCRLLEVYDGWLALNLARDDDWDLLPAWLEVDSIAGWDAVAEILKQRPLTDCIERGRMLGLAVAASGPLDSGPSATGQAVLDQHAPLQSAHDNPYWFFADDRVGDELGQHSHKSTPLVVDLSSLWAGPLCTHLLQQLGARVIKVESINRPDGARRGNADFYNLLNAGKASVALDFSMPDGRAQLRKLCARADIVIEASRPRALRQLGIDSTQIVAENPALTWISITGYGRFDPMANWVAFGDDAAVAAGLSRLVGDSSGEIAFCGDAVADPLTGLHAALLAWHGYQTGGGGLRALALRDMVGYCIEAELGMSVERLQTRAGEWRAVIERAGLLDVQPVARRAAGVARELGADNGDFF